MNPKELARATTRFEKLSKRLEMPRFPFHNIPFIHEMSTMQIAELQHAIEESARELQDVQSKRGQIEKELIERRKETARRVELMMGKSEEIDALQQLGQILQEEMQLAEQLNEEPDAERKHEISLLQQRSETASNKAKNLVAEILEVKQRLAEIKKQHRAGRAAVPTIKSKRNQKKL
ncbi:filamin-A-interacting protein 1 [Oryzias melastigma]|uniref:filamin-A-interacting protein 1 n=1 Tax=Oryzias melastigma TaxID=30732 RepID=UPI000CF7C73E|nr:filamin-A-interacting protein 1 [Oryzias melastigma]